MTKANFYCVREKKKVTATVTSETNMKGKKLLRGVCKCGTKLTAFASL